MSAEIAKVREEISAALNIFMQDGLAVDVGFYADSSGETVTAEFYSADGYPNTKFNITFTVEEIS